MFNVISYKNANMAIMCICMLFAVLMFPDTAQSENIKVNIKGYSDGENSGIQKDRKEAILDAKRQAIERAGVNIESTTTVKNFVTFEDFIESKSKGIILPGYEIVEIGYNADNTVYEVALVGEIQSLNIGKENGNNKWYYYIGILLILIILIVLIVSKRKALPEEDKISPKNAAPKEDVSASSVDKKNKDQIDCEAVTKIRKWLEDTVDEEYLNIATSVNCLARSSRKIAHITPKGNQPHLEKLILRELEKEGYCKINDERREITFLKSLR